MATFHGFKVTNLRSWEGMEGVATSGTLYWNGKRLGDFVDDGNGGCVCYRFPCQRELSERIAEQLPNLCTDIYGPEAAWMTPDLDTLVLTLCDLAETERGIRREFGKIRRRGGRVLATARKGREGYHMLVANELASDDDILAAAKRSVPGCDEYRVWRKAPVLSEKDDERVTDKALLDRILSVERDAKARLARHA